MKCIAVIPARYQSARLPGKALLDIAGKPMVQHVYERTARARGVDRVIVATDDGRIFEAVRRFGGEAMMTSPDHRSGSERMAEVAGRVEAEWFVNVQGDEPLIDPGTIEATLAALPADPRAVVSTPRIALTDVESVIDPHVVKVVTGPDGYALYFSRSPVPFHQFPEAGRVGYAEHLRTHPELIGRHFKHIGLYCFRADFLRRYPHLTPTPLEQAEKLEQLRILEHGYAIRVVTAAVDSTGVDTEEDLRRVRQLFEKAGGTKDEG